MDVLRDILQDMDWRMGELAVLKTIPYRYDILPAHQYMLRKYSVPAVYAVWEGFVKNSFQCYIREINKLQLNASELHIHILAHALTSDRRLSIENSFKDFSKKIKFVKTYNQVLVSPIQINLDVPTKSNVNYQVINKILTTFNLSSIPDSFKKGLDKLLLYRNSVAHGDQAISITEMDITNFIELVINLMSEVYLRIEEGIKLKTYLSHSEIE